MKSIQIFSSSVHQWIHSPLKVLWVCGAFALASLLFNGSLLKLYKLHRDRDQLTQQISTLQGDILKLSQDIQWVKDPAFLERQALDKYDLAGEHDLVFVFPDE